METDWADILEPQGWTLDRAQSRGGERFWVRPGKSVKDGHSASTDYEGNPGFYIWSTSAGFETETPLTKMYVQAHYTHRGDMSAFSKDCLRRGFGDAARPSLTLGELDLVSNNEVPEAEPVPARYSHDDAGNGMRLWQKVRDKYRHVYEEKELYLYNGIRWGKEYTGALVREWLQCTEEMAKQGREEQDEALIKWAKRSRSQAATNAAISMMKSMDGATISATDMNLAPDHINLNNGTYNVKTQVLEPHDRSQLMTRSMKANYDLEATCPKFEAFMEQVLPDPEVRQYVQRAAGYSILGRADRRAFFLIYGPSGTGKSQFLSTMEHVFGDYATTAAEGTFRTKESGGPNNDLHGLRGRRFVSTSETAENATFNENLLKRLSGRDKVVSRDLYQSNIEWTPECALWLATNHPPRFNSDDDAIWKRAKLVPFLTRFGTDIPEIPDYAREHLYAEADGILNWVLAGLQDFLANGLQEPDAVVSAAADHRSQSDSVVRFLEDQLADGILAESEDGSIRTRELFAMYEAWSRTSGERGLGSRRFINRLESSGRAKYAQTASHSVWKGIYSTRAIGWIGQGVIPGEMDKS
jgi:putative DNA primase/helicase